MYRKLLSVSFTSWFLLLICCLLPRYTIASTDALPAPPPGEPPFVVVIDPGHGGIDPGAIGKVTNEKTVALSVALKLGKLMAQVPNVQVVYTRTTDVLPGDNYQGSNKQRINHSLRQRAIIANKAHGNLFISIHCNSAYTRHRVRSGYRTVYVRSHGKRVRRRVPTYRTYNTPSPARGTETYVWGIQKNSDKDLALKENGPLADDPEFKSLLNSDNSAEGQIMVNMMRRDVMRHSLDIAANVEGEFSKVGRVSREVKQRQVGIWVLQATGMPSVLIETGFISNPEEEHYLINQQDELVGCIYKAFTRYLAGIRGISAEELAGPGKTSPAIPQPAAGTIYKIQLMVSNDPVKADDNRFKKLDGPVSIESVKLNNQKVYRCLEGEYKDYDSADRELEKIKLMGFRDAFIVGYQNGKRLE
ncbi:N-acetylmuramoyl-L-alanine amidase [Compostibacter hankyongensis]|uniref:N-acetylmuramoyl-L-alanine amidase n=1 Tax=Compostibacter hankyongensis TaxID=1007089 RepID=A0ABP8FPT5_9BACT